MKQRELFLAAVALIGLVQDGRVLGYFAATGVRPMFMERLRAFGVSLPDELFLASRHFE